jgi:vitamin B12/bleomycin/antimicrobial peptide transport system ATP-binding/permease protein
MSTNIFPLGKDNPSSKGLSEHPSSAAKSERTFDLSEKISPDDPGDENLRRRYLLRRFWQSGRGYWGKHGHGSAWPLTGATLLVIVCNLATLYGINTWNRGIFDALEKHDATRVLKLALLYFPLLAASVFLIVMQVHTRMTMQRRSRAWLNDYLIDRWLANGRYYQLNLVSGDHQNPEFRFARVFGRRHGYRDTGLSRHYRHCLCGGGERSDGGHRPAFRPGLGKQEPS